jgi:membrane associated rhomboid family serine protease
LATVDVVSRPSYQPLERESTSVGTAVRVILGFVAVLYVVNFVDALAGDPLVRSAGIEPRQADGLDGIALAPMLHASWDHLMANTVPLLVLGFFLLLSGVRRAVTVTAMVWLVGGAGVWLTGAPGTIHIGASILVFGWLVYLMLRGLFSRLPGQLALGAVLLLAYGGLLWGVLPGQPGVSWQGHLFGALGGALAAWQLDRRSRPMRGRADRRELDSW